MLHCDVQVDSEDEIEDEEEEDDESSEFSLTDSESSDDESVREAERMNEELAMLPSRCSSDDVKEEQVIPGKKYTCSVFAPILFRYFVESTKMTTYQFNDIF